MGGCKLESVLVTGLTLESLKPRKKMLQSNSLLATKLYISVARPNLVSRPRLLARLNQGMRGKLVLLSAPPGFGKTTLLGEWRASAGQDGQPFPMAWVSLDEGDNDPV